MPCISVSSSLLNTELVASCELLNKGITLSCDVEVVTGVSASCEVLNKELTLSCGLKNIDIEASASVVCTVLDFEHVWLMSNELLRLRTDDGMLLITPLPD